MQANKGEGLGGRSWCIEHILNNIKQEEPCEPTLTLQLGPSLESKAPVQGLKLVFC